MEKELLKRMDVIRWRAVDALSAIDMGRWDHVRRLLEAIRDDASVDDAEPLPTFRDHGAPVG